VQANARTNFDELRKILGINDGYNYEEVSEFMLKQMEISGDLTPNSFRQLFMKTFPEISKVATGSKDGKYLIEESMNCLFNLMDPDKDGFVDSLELGIGLTKIFPSKRESKLTNRVDSASIFSKMDFNEQGAIFLSDV
jgi:hypothetical protein